MTMTMGENLTAEKSIVPLTHAVGTVDGAGVDSNEVHELLVLVHVGAITVTGTLDLKLQNSDDDAVADPYADISGAALAQIVQAGQNKLYLIRVRVKALAKRWIRPVAVVGTDTVDVSVEIVKSYVKYPKKDFVVLDLSI